MLSTLFTNPFLFIIYLIALLVAITIHEFAHAITADYLGDPTPRIQGRVSLNPLVHLDMFGTLLIVLMGFGWGKPVVFDPYNLKHPRKDAAVISFAGPLSNFILAIVLSLVLRLSYLFDHSTFFTISYFFFAPAISINIMLGIFNLIPIHPLDGFKIVGGILPEDKAHEWYQLERYGMIFLILLIIPLGQRSLVSSIIGPIISFITNLLIPEMRGSI
ncbi:MAG: site-2 protease family protein [bacterium]|nr:site-2 protease family protein [bacterium]